jgi:imidazolonepropionase-like amidohydrolase
VGELADAVFYEADPWEDPSVLLRPMAVMRAGQLR